MRTSVILIFTSIISCLAYGQFEDPPIPISHIDFNYKMAKGDLDNDGDDDIVSVTSYYYFNDKNNDHIVLYENNGQGSFEKGVVLYKDAFNPRDIAITDINEDGKLDILYADDSIDSSYIWLRNMGGLNFSNPNIIPVMPSPLALKVADLNGDGKEDIIGTFENGISDIVAWMEKVGPNNFLTHFISDTLGSNPGILASDDDGDGDLEVYIYRDKIWKYENLGGGSFGPIEYINWYPPGFTSIALSDVDGDSYKDLIYSSIEFIRVAFNNGFGDYLGAALTLENSVSLGGRLYINSFDVDNNGYNDILFSKGGQITTLFKSLGSGNFETPIEIYDSIPSGIASDIDLIDVDNDQVLDLVTCSVDHGYILWHKNLNSSGLFGVSQLISPLTTDVPNELITCDLDNDGDEDVISFSDWTGWIVWFENLGGDKFSWQRIIDIIDEPKSITTDDINGDGLMDILAISNYYLDGKIRWYENLGGQFTTHVINDTLQHELIEVYDFDNDGDPDIASMFAGGELRYLKNDGLGNFSVISSTYLILTAPRKACSADLDNDGFKDLVFTDNNGIFVCLNIDGSSFSTPIIYGASLFIPFGVDIADIDLDGDIDIAYTEYYGHTFGWLENLGGGTFTEAMTIDSLNWPRIIKADDMNGDGFPDLIVSLQDSVSVRCYENDLGSFSPNLFTPVLINKFIPEDLCISDIDSDLDLDVISSGNQGPGFIVASKNKANDPIDEPDIESAVVYPNPFYDFCRVAFPHPLNGNHAVKLYDDRGRLIMDYGYPQGNMVTINGEKLRSAYYFLKVIGEYEYDLKILHLNK